MPLPPKTPRVSPQIAAGGVVPHRPHIVTNPTSEAPRATYMGFDLARHGSDVTIIERPRCAGKRTLVERGARGWGKTAQQEMTAAQFRKQYEQRPYACPPKCDCMACVRYRREQESE